MNDLTILAIVFVAVFSTIGLMLLFIILSPELEQMPDDWKDPYEYKVGKSGLLEKHYKGDKK